MMNTTNTKLNIKKDTAKKNTILNSYRFRLLVCILVPVLASIIFYFTLNIYLLHDMTQQSLNKCRISHNNFSTDYEEKFYNLHQTSMMLFNDSLFQSLNFSKTRLTPSENYQLKNMCDMLKTLSATNAFTTQIGFISNTNNRYICSSYTAFLEDYHSRTYYGTVVTKSNYLENYAKRDSILQLQPMDTYINKSVIPLLQFQSGSRYLNSPLVYYLDKDAFSADLIKYMQIPSSTLMVYSPYTNQMIASSDVIMETAVCECLDLQNIENYSDFITIDGTKYYCFISPSKTSYVDLLLFITLIPYTDLFMESGSELLLSLLCLLFTGILTALLSHRFMLHLYSPVQGLISTASAELSGLIADTDTTTDEFLFLDNRMKELVTSNKELESNMNSALPLIYNRYILNILYQRDYYNQALEPLLKKFKFHFPYPFFTCAIFVPQFTAAYQTDFSKQTQNMIMSKLSNVLKWPNSSIYNKYVFHLEEMEFCMIYNSQNADMHETLEKDATMLRSLFSFDENYVHLYIAFGGTHEGLPNLRLSWVQANKAMAKLSAFQEQTIAFYEKENGNPMTYSMEADDDNHLFSYLYKGEFDSAMKLLKEIVTDNENFHISDDGLRDLYVHLYELGNTVLRKKDISATELMGEAYMGLNQFSHSCSNLQRSNYITAFYQKLCLLQEEDSNSTFDLNELKNYVDEHYCEEIYLETLAARFKTSPKYISRLLRQALGVPFKQYITDMRITKAKELLNSTDMRIEDIALACGFTNRNTFVRVFKQAQGVVPSEFRKYNSDETMN